MMDNPPIFSLKLLIMRLETRYVILKAGSPVAVI